MCTMSINHQFNGIELTFDSKPAAAIRDAMKAAGFRWHSQKKLWYAKQTADRMELAQKLAGAAAPATPAEPVKKESAAAAAKPEPVSKYGIKVGDILEDSWGYEQTNVEFYKVTKIISACKIEIVEVGHIQSNYESHGMACDVVPDIDREIGEPIQKMVSQDAWEKKDGRWHVKINSSVSLTAWDGRPCYCSWYY